MPATTLLDTGSICIVDYRCTAVPGDAPFEERHRSHMLAYVRRGSFGCRTRGRLHELVPGSMFVGHPGDDYVCLHEHHTNGDECLSFQLAPALAASLDDQSRTWRVGSVPPVPELGVMAELAQATAEGRSDVGLDEIGMMLAARFVDLVRGKRTSRSALVSRDRRRVVDTARWIDENAHEPITLTDAARHSGLSDFHFLRLFRAGLDVTPHQYLVRCRLRRAARLLSQADKPVTDVAFESGFGDLSNFIRTFRRAAGMSPRAFRRLSRAERGVLSVRFAAG